MKKSDSEAISYLQDDADKALHESEKRYRHLFETAQDGILILDAESGAITDVNSFLTKMLGYTQEELIGKRLWEIGAFVDVKESKAAFEELQRKEYIRYEDLPLQTKEGQSRQVEFVSNVYRVNGKKIIQCNIRDITKRRQAEEQLRISLSTYEGILNSISETIYILDENGVFLYVNFAAGKMYGYSRDYFIGRTSEFLGAPGENDLVEIADHIRQAFNGQSREFEFWGIRKDGTTFPKDIVLTPGVYFGKKVVIAVARDITERKHAEKSLRESKELFSNAFAHAPIGVALVAPDGRWLKVNRALCNLVGYSEAELLALTFQDITHPDDLEVDLQNVRWMVDGEISSYQMEKRYIHARGHLVTVLLDVSLVRNEQGQPLYFISQIQDITERKRAEIILRESNEKFHQLADNITDAFWIRSPDMSVVHYLSPAFERIWGRSVESLYANPHQWEEFILPEDRERVLAAFAALTADAPSLDIEYRIVRPGGGIRWVHVRGFKVRDTTGKLIRHIGIVTDITDRRSEEKAQVLVHSQLTNLYNNLPEALFSFDIVQNRMLQVSPAHETVFGYSPEEFFKNPKLWYEIIIPEDKPIIDAGYPVLSEGRIVKQQFRILRPDGETRWIEAIIKPNLDENGKLVRFDGISSDITERKRAEEELQFRNLILSTQQEASIDGILVVDENAGIVSYNNRFIEMWGVPLELVKQKVDGPVLSFVTTQVTDPVSFKQRVQYLYEHKQETSWDEIILKNGLIFDRYSAPMVGPDDRYYGRVWYFRDITDRKQAQKQITLLAHTLKSIAECVSITDMNDTILFVNDAFLKTYGYSEQELMGKNISIVRSPNNPSEATRGILDATLAGGWSGELLNRRKDGRDFTVSLSTSFIRDEHSVIVALVGVATDITERRHAEELLRESEEHYRQIIDTAHEGIWTLDASDRTTLVNQHLADMLGYTVKEMIGKTIYEFLDEEGKSITAKSLENRRQGIDEQLDFKFKRKDGTTLWCLMETSPLLDHNQKYVGALAMLIDITERKRAEKELIRLRMGIERSSDAFFVTDTLGIIQYVNPAFEQIYGYQSHEAVGQTPRILKSGRNVLSFYEQLWSTLLSGKAFSGEIINKAKDGHFVAVEVSNNPILDEKNTIIGFMGIHRDITVRNQSREKQKSLEGQLQQAQKLESLGTLASGVAHDFNNILGIILGHSTLMELTKENPEKFSQSIEAIMKATQRGAALVKQLLTFARKTEPLFETVNINDMIKEIDKLLKETIHKTINISTSLQPDLPTITADANQIHQVLLNLCVNARDAMPKGGTLSISSGIIEGEAINLQFATITARQYVRIEVADTGIGMDESTRRRIFEPFFTTKGPGKGTGLGLAVVFGIIEHHKGFIDVRSVPGEGTCFSVYLPIPERALEVLQPAKKSYKEIPGGTETILIIEDEEMLGELMMASLVSKGYTVLTAKDGIQGVEVYQSHQDRIALVISDLGLPLLDGQDVFKKIRGINPQAKIIIASGFISPEMKSEMYKAGLKNFIQKPYMLEDVLQKIRETIDTTG